MEWRQIAVEKIVLQVLMVVSVMSLVGSQGCICFAMPEEWYVGLVSSIVLVLCVVYNRKE